MVDIYSVLKDDYNNLAFFLSSFIRHLYQNRQIIKKILPRSIYRT